MVMQLYLMFSSWSCWAKDPFSIVMQSVQVGFVPVWVPPCTHVLLSVTKLFPCRMSCYIGHSLATFFTGFDCHLFKTCFKAIASPGVSRIWRKPALTWWGSLPVFPASPSPSPHVPLKNWNTGNNYALAAKKNFKLNWASRHTLICIKA